MTEIPGIILAGGLSTRMGGGDKGLLHVGGSSLLERVMERLRPQVCALALNANGDRARFDRFDLPVVPDSIEGWPGPLAGVLAGMDWASEIGARQIVTVAADTPFFPHNLVAKLIAGAVETDLPIALAASPDQRRGLVRHPTFGLWPVALRDDLRDALKDGVRKVVEWTDRHGCTAVSFQNEPLDPFFNVNTPDDMAQAEKMLAEYDL